MTTSGGTITVRKLEENYCEFTLEGVTPAVANTLRRTILADVPTLAIDEVVIVENSSVLFDETLAHRLALIPLMVDEDAYEALLQCYEEGRGGDCIASFSLELEAERPTVVYSGHIKFEGFTSELASLAKVVVKPVSNLIPIVKLAPGQKVALVANARMGIGREHAKWKPVSVAAYKCYPKIQVLKKEVCEEDCRKCVEACPRGVLNAEGGELKVVAERIEECNTCRACEEACPGVIKVSWDNSRFIFKVEGIGVLPVSKIVEVAMRRVVWRMDKLLSEVWKAASAGSKEQFYQGKPAEVPL